MKAYVSGKIRDTKKMSFIAESSGDPNDCYGTYSVLLLDERDGKLFDWRGYYFAGHGPDSLLPVARVQDWLEENPKNLTEEEADKIESLLCE